MALDVVEANEGDVPSWLEIVREVEPLFGPMPEFTRHLRRNIERGSALCVRTPSGGIAGGVTYRPAPHFEISWLAVRAQHQSHGVGRALLAAVLHRYGEQPEVTATTFGEDVLAGQAARRLYLSAGFHAAERLPDGPGGGTRQRFRRPGTHVTAPG